MSDFSRWTAADVAKLRDAIAKRGATELIEVGKNSRSKKRAPKTRVGQGAGLDIGRGAAKKRKQNPEYEMQLEYARRMAQKWPGVMIFVDTDAHVPKTMFQQVRANRLKTKGEKWPDTLVCQGSGDYIGLWMEFKKVTPYKMDGVTLKKTKDDHTEKQAATMARLRAKGYFCTFVWSVEMAMEVTDKYLSIQ